MSTSVTSGARCVGKLSLSGIMISRHPRLPADPDSRALVGGCRVLGGRGIARGLADIQIPIHRLVELRPARMLRIGIALSEAQESVDLAIEVFRVMQNNRLQSLGALGRSPFQFPVVAKNAMEKAIGQRRGKVRDGPYPFLDHERAERDVPQEAPTVGVVED